MDLVIKKWIANSTTTDISSCYFCSNIGVVYLGVKPAEILNVSQAKLTQCILLKKPLRFKILGKKNDKYKLFVYNPKKLEETINNKYTLKYLKQLGYSKHFNLDNYVTTLTNKLKYNHSFPHEIGFFLGYPVKDVLGFMGLTQLPLAKTMGWQMYGNTDSSEQLYYHIKSVKDEILNYAKQTQIKVC